MIQVLKRSSLLVLVICIAWLGLVVGQSMTRQMAMLAVQAASAPPQQERYENLELFQKVLHFVEQNYVDEVKNKDLVQGAIKGMLETLDPHSNFLPAEVFRDMKVDTAGKFGGVGIEIGLKDNVLTVIAPIEDSPAWKAGVKSGDRVVKINGETTKGVNLTEAVSKMRGKKGSKVVLGIYREGFERVKDFSIERDIIKIQSVKSEELEPGFAYVRLTNFNESAAVDMKRAIDRINSKNKVKGLVFDLRNNPGGLLDQAVDVTSLFMEDGVVVSTIGRNRDQKEVKYAKKGAPYKDFPVAILVNSSSASASEIVAGALQDQHRAMILGQTTFGKGSVQNVIELGGDMGLKLTVARYYTPSGRSIQEKGVHPDIILDDYDPKLLSEAKKRGDTVRERDLKGHMTNTDNEAVDMTVREFKQEELESLGKDPKKSKLKDEESTPVRMEPKEDFQVKEALNYLKSYEIFKKISGKDLKNKT